MAIINKYPYTDFENLNLDWIIKKVKGFEDEVGEYRDSAKEYAESSQASAENAQASAENAQASAENASLSAGNAETASINTNGVLEATQNIYENIRSLLTYSYPESVEVETTFTNNYMRPADGVVVSSPNYRLSEPIEVPAYTLLAFDSWVSTGALVIAQVNSNGEYIRGIYVGSASVQHYEYVADEITYVRVCYNSNDITDFKAYLTPYTVKERKPQVILTPQYVGTNGSFNNSPNYQRTQTLTLYKGETVRFRYAGSSGAKTLTLWTPTGAFDNVVMEGNSQYNEVEYTAPYHQRIMICARTDWSYTEPSDVIIVTPADFADITMYFKELKYADNTDILLNKSIDFLGDSFIGGNYLGYKGTAWNSLALNYNMTAYNGGVNGSPVAVYGTVDNALCQRYSELPQADYIVIQGGSNDYNNSVPIGSNTDTVNTTFKGALNTIITGLKTMYPEAKIIVSTLPRRFAEENSAGLYESDYAEATREIASLYSLPVLDMFNNLGIEFVNELNNVFDEGIVYMHGRNRHLSYNGWQHVYNFIYNSIKSI